LKNFVSGRTSEATAASAFEKHSSVLRYLGAIDPTGKVLRYTLILCFFLFLLVCLWIEMLVIWVGD
jgi:hypothetical protein